PNMGGKSTVMRQAALMVLLAHTGSFVPARRARIGLVDRIFTRVGAADDLGRGESTFMVEMRETAQILTQATVRSMVVLDEIGRGTATYDGLSLAWAITEFLHDQIGCRAMFATHYHELCGLSSRLAGVKNAHVTVHEQRGRVVFLHRLEEGAAGRSYGIHVGKLAGLPRQVLRRAGKILTRLEQQERVGLSPQLDLFASQAPLEEDSTASAEHLGPARAKEALDLLLALDPDELSPRQAHARLCDLVALLSEESD
ncbi:MAG: MutS-related protein, partial [Nannocystaceae bacterium]